MQGVIFYNKIMILLKFIKKNKNLCYNNDEKKIIINNNL